MLGSNPSADSVASTDSGGMLRHPLSSVCQQRARIGRGTKALNPGGTGAKPPLPARPQASPRNRAPSDNACIGLWLLKNSLSRNAQKFHRTRMP
jgi:hypothetical protein